MLVCNSRSVPLQGSEGELRISRMEVAAPSTSVSQSLLALISGVAIHGDRALLARFLSPHRVMNSGKSQMKYWLASTICQLILFVVFL